MRFLSRCLVRALQLATGLPMPCVVHAQSAPQDNYLTASVHRPSQSICSAPWFKPRARAQLEAAGDMPMSITMEIRHPSPTTTGCSAWISIHSKSALAALMGPPVIMDQVHKMEFQTAASDTDPGISSKRATINAQASYTRLFGEASFQGNGMLGYAGLDIREGKVIPGATLNSSFDLEVHSLATDEKITTIKAPAASVVVSARTVGRKQTISTMLGRRECLPITYEKRASLGPLTIGDQVFTLEPATMHVTEWYCPSESFVLRTEVRQDGRTEVIDTTALGVDDDNP